MESCDWTVFWQYAGISEGQHWMPDTITATSPGLEIAVAAP